MNKIEVLLEQANVHQDDINNDECFTRMNNCPYCNDDKIHIQLQQMIPYYDHWAEIHKEFKCCRCGRKFWENWCANVDNYFFHDDSEPYLNEFGDYEDTFYDDRYDAFCESLKDAMKSGVLPDFAYYKYTTLELSSDELLLPATKCENIVYKFQC